MSDHIKLLLRVSETDTVIAELLKKSEALGRDDQVGQLIARRLAERAELTGRLPHALSQEYERLRARTPDPVVALFAGSCSGCSQRVPPGIRQRLLERVEVVRCENCGRFLR